MGRSPGPPHRRPLMATQCRAGNRRNSSGVLLLRLVANSLFGWLWADPVAWRGEACCPVPVTGKPGCGPNCDCC